MGYCVRWDGSFATDKPLAAEHLTILREQEKTEKYPDDAPDRRFNPWCVRADAAGFEVLTDKPGDWKPWLQWLLDRFLTPWGYTLSGTVGWRGDEDGDAGGVTIENGKVKARRPRLAAPAWLTLSDSDRAHVGDKIADAMREDYDRHRTAWLSAMQALGVAPTSDRTVFDD